jgi:hypothetical protein
MNNLFNKIRLKILLALFLSFFLVKNFAPEIFLANTPIINPTFLVKIKNLPSNTIQSTRKLIAQISNLFNKKESQIAEYNKVDIPPGVIFKPVTKKVSAGEDKKTGKVYIKIEPGAKYRIVGTIEIDGKSYPKIEFVD